MKLSNRQALHQLVRSGRYYLGLFSAIIDAGIALRIVPPGAHEIVAGAGAFLALIVVHLLALWQPKRLAWTHEQKIEESKRLIAEGRLPLAGYEYLIHPAALPPAEEK